MMPCSRQVTALTLPTIRSGGDGWMLTSLIPLKTLELFEGLLFRFDAYRLQQFGHLDNLAPYQCCKFLGTAGLRLKAVFGQNLPNVGRGNGCSNGAVEAG